MDHLVLRNVFATRDFVEQRSGFESAAVIEEHRDRRAKCFLRGVAVNSAGATVPTHDDAFSGHADYSVARNIDDSLQAGEFELNAAELLMTAPPGQPNAGG